MTHDELLALLVPFAAERLALLQRHDAGAQVVSHYDFNNTYQYVINREETHIGWLRAAIEEAGGTMPAASAALGVPEVARAKQMLPAAFRAVLEDDAKHVKAFVERWRAKVEGMTHARHRTMLGVVLGESTEHGRLFAQAAEGSEDVLGRRTGGVARQGGVLAQRWQE